MSTYKSIADKVPVLKFEFTKRELKNILVEATSCSVQHNGWPCGTCFYAISPRLNNHHWQAVLAWRGDYPNLKFTVNRSRLVKEVYAYADHRRYHNSLIKGVKRCAKVK